MCSGSIVICDNWYHTMCEGLTPIEEVMDGNYTCVNCSGWVNRSEVFIKKINQLIDEEDILNRDVVQARELCDNLKAEYTNIIGSHERSLNLTLESIKVVCQAYHGNVMVGNHCVIVLKQFEVLTSIISGSNQNLYTKFNEIFKIFSDIMTIVMSRRLLEDHEVSALEKLCLNFGRMFPLYFPQRSITRKIHELIFNVPNFVQRHKTIGTLSEQEGESKHASINAEIRPLANVRNASERICLVLEREELRSMIDKTLLIPENRICKTCKEIDIRTFLRAGVDGNRHCPICHPDCFDKNC